LRSRQVSALVQGRLVSVVKDFSILLIFLVVFTIFSASAPSFLTTTNLANLLEQVSLIGIIAMGMTILLISGNFDLSVGGQVAFIGLVSVKALNAYGLAAGVAIALATGLGCGLANGFAVTTLRVNSLIATLGSGLIFSGAAFLLAGASPIPPNDERVQQFANSDVGGIPTAGIIFVGVAIVTAWLLHFTVGGREIYAVGANPEAARYAGVRLTLVRYFSFAFTGVLCGISALLLVGFLNVADPSAATTYPLDVIASTVLGGVSIAGGRGSVHMAIVGVLMIGMISNGFNLLNLDPNLYRIMTGAIIVLAVAFDSLVQHRVARLTQRVPHGGEDEPSRAPSAAARDQAQSIGGV
jgi:ribose transport system permease protein